MRLGIDLGTTRTRVAAAVKGNYPIISFHSDDGGICDWYPSLIAVKKDRILFGLEANEVQYDATWEVFRSLKRLFGEKEPQSLVTIGQIQLPLIDWLQRFLSALRADLLRKSNLELHSQENLEVMVGVPANANSNQRFMTVEAFRKAGFEVLGMLNEPSAAGLEYAHRFRQSDLTRRREYVVVYDFGGGTFDVSIIRMAQQNHEVIASEGISLLGGDDFDEALMELTLASPVLSGSAEQWISRARLLNLCREAKESINPNTRKITIDLGQISVLGGVVMIGIHDFYEKCLPMVQQTLQSTESVMHSSLQSEDGTLQSLACVYLVGGSCELPLLSRSLKEKFGKRVRRSPFPSAATAIGLAIFADQRSGYTLQDRFSRHFGVWREANFGKEMVFDPIFTKETPLPPPDKPLIVSRMYHPAHNIGHYRFVECAQLGRHGEPTGDLIYWDDMLIPFDARLCEKTGLTGQEVQSWDEGSAHQVEEVYKCDSRGIIEVDITDRTSGISRSLRVRTMKSKRARP